VCIRLNENLSLINNIK